MGNVLNNDQEYLKKNEHLSFDKNPSFKMGTPKLTINKAKSEFQFTSSNGTTKKKEFRRNTSEFQILMQLIDNHRVPIETGKLIDHLKPLRDHAEDTNKKQRVTDKVTAIRKSLGEEVITTTPNGYIIECELIRI